MKNVSKVILTCLSVLFLSLSFFGCKSEPDLTPKINAVFYTLLDPATNTNTSGNTTLLTGEKWEYYLVVDFQQPNMDVVKMVLEYENDGETRTVIYNITPQYENQKSWWTVYWTEVPENTVRNLKFYLETSDGVQSDPYNLTINLWK